MFKLVFIITVLFLIPFSAAAAGASEKAEAFERAVQQYRSEAYEEAAASFRESSKTAKGRQAVNLYNLGNALVKHAEQLLSTDSEAAASLLEESLNAYRRALEIEKGFLEAGYNMEVVKRLLSKLTEETEENQDNEKQQEQEQKQQPPEEGPQEDDQEEQQQKPEMSEEDKKLIEEILENEQEKKEILNHLEGSYRGGRSGKNW